MESKPDDGPTDLPTIGAWDSHNPPDPSLIADCVHCGFCLPTCPSYSVFGEEMDSPRGRITLMRVGHEAGETISPQMTTHFDRCLGCMACVTACPSGVQYDRLIEQVRPQVERYGARGWRDRLKRRLVLGVFTHPSRLRAFVPLLAAQHRLGISRRLASWLRGTRLESILRLAPSVSLRASTRRLPLVTHTQAAIGRGRVAFMQGCTQRVLFGDVNAATVRVLAAEGWDVYAPRSPRCCGALELHSGLEDGAMILAKRTIARYEDFNAVVVNVAGCGSAMKEYGKVLADDPEWTDRAAAFSRKVRDIHEFLDEHEPVATRHPVDLRVAYHDPCHLAHAQGIRQAPRRLLAAIPGLQIEEPAEWEICCGSAGIYNVMQPEAAAELGRRKADNLRATGATAIAAANPGCAMQIGAHAGDDVRVYHPVSLLDMSIRGARP